jgi:hypothetical protein
VDGAITGPENATDTAKIKTVFFIFLPFRQYRPVFAQGLCMVNLRLSMPDLFLEINFEFRWLNKDRLRFADTVDLHAPVSLYAAM